MTDQWDEHLRCPRCRNTGMASLSQFGDAEIPTVGLVTAGFKAVQTEYGPGFHCGPATSQWSRNAASAVVAPDAAIEGTSRMNISRTRFGSSLRCLRREQLQSVIAASNAGRASVSRSSELQSSIAWCARRNAAYLGHFR